MAHVELRVYAIQNDWSKALTENLATWMPLLVPVGVVFLLVMLASGIVAFAPKFVFEPFRRLADYVARCPFKAIVAAALLMLGPVRDAV
ncbi:MAG: hypothetical protein IJG84_13500, partial [Kiritimatiellae bacterium]|nr:hypothetical protein [Kiritimatiellia bacterium]